MQIQFPLEIFYDGSCRVCAREMQHYGKRCPAGRLRFVDISAADFKASDYGKTHQELMHRLHVRTSKGDFWTGIDAFRAIWQAFPPGSGYRWLSRMIAVPGINQLARLGYALFARYRHLLPGNNGDCRDGSCRLPH